ncbi:hypothetical protein Tco_0206093 [Tanacetum coccineum]
MVTNTLSMCGEGIKIRKRKRRRIGRSVNARRSVWEREIREKERERERAKEKEQERGRDKEREKERERRERREREERDREKMREKRREDERDHNGGEDVMDWDRDRDRDRKRRRRDDDYKEERDRERERERERKVSRRREDSVENGAVKKVDESVADKKETRTCEEDMAEEQRKLDDEMEKRRRRVQEWQKKRRKEESEKENADGKTAGKTWTLDGESDDEEALPNGDAMDKDEIDPLDAFMNTMVIPEVTKLTAEVSVLDEKSSDDKVKENRRKKTAGRSLGRIIPGEDSYLEYPTLDNDEDPLEDEDDDEFMKRVKKTKVEKLSLVDHSKIDYIPFRKNFYIELKDIQKMTHDSFVYAVPFTLATIRAACKSLACIRLCPRGQSCLHAPSTCCGPDVCDIHTSYVSRQCTSSVGDNAAPCLLRRLAIPNLLVFFDFYLTLLMAKKDMHIYVSHLKDAEIKTLIATYDIPLDLRPRLPDSNFRISILPAGNTDMGIYSRIFDSSGVRISFSSFLLAVLKYFKVHISQLVPLGLSKVITFEVLCRSLNIEPTVTLFRVFQTLSKQGDWFSIAKHGGSAPGCMEDSDKDTPTDFNQDHVDVEAKAHICEAHRTDISKIIRKLPKTSKHGHEKRKSTREAKDSKPKPD